MKARHANPVCQTNARCITGTWACCQSGGSSRRHARSLLWLLSEGNGLLLGCQLSLFACARVHHLGRGCWPQPLLEAWSPPLTIPPLNMVYFSILIHSKLLQSRSTSANGQWAA